MFVAERKRISASSSRPYNTTAKTPTMTMKALATMIVVLVLASSSRSGSIVAVLAFSTTPSSLSRTTSSTSSPVNTCFNIFSTATSRTSGRRRPAAAARSARGSASKQRYIGASIARMSSSTSVEDDLDAALDDIFQFDEKDFEGDDDLGFDLPPPTKKMKKPHVAAVPTKEKSSEPLDFTDPEVLSTSNPRWVAGGLDPKVIDVLSAKGITTFTPVQGEAFDPILERRDVIGRSRTGTGKTLAFGLPALVRLVEFTERTGKRSQRDGGRMQRGRAVSMLVLCPTRELARQVQEEIDDVARPMGLFTEVFHGGVSYGPQSQALRQGLDILVGTPGRIIDHLDRGNLDLSEVDLVVLDEADEMLQMGFAEDVEVILEDAGSANDEQFQCLMFSATTPPWVKEIGRKYQTDAVSIDATGEEGGARVATTVRHMAVQVPPGEHTKKQLLEDIIAVEISKDAEDEGMVDYEELAKSNPIAAAAAEKKRNATHAMQQKIFGKTIVFTETKKLADELVSGGVFKSLTAQALHGDVGQKQRDATLNAFRRGAFNVLVATDVAARGIDIKDVDLVVQFDPPRDVDTYVHRSGRTGRAGSKGVSVLMFNRQQARDIVRIERDLGHGFKFDLTGLPSTEAVLTAAAKTSAIACKTIPSETSKYFKKSAAALLADGGGGEDPVDVVARCLAAISRRSTAVQSRSLITGELGLATVQMTNRKGRPVAPNDVVFTVGKLARMSRRDEALTFDGDVGKIQTNSGGSTSTAIFDMGVDDAERLIEFSKDIDAGGAVFKILKELEIERGRNFGVVRTGRNNGRRYNSRGGGVRNGNNFNNNRFQRNGRASGYYGSGSGQGGGHRSGGYRRENNYHGQNHRSGHEFRGQRNDGGNSRYGGQQQRGGRYDNNNSNRYSNRHDNDEW